MRVLRYIPVLAAMFQSDSKRVTRNKLYNGSPISNLRLSGVDIDSHFRYPTSRDTLTVIQFDYHFHAASNTGMSHLFIAHPFVGSNMFRL
jgi:hypothetical protein